MKFRPWFVLAVGVLTAAAGASDHKEARRLRESGEILPLEEVLKRNQPSRGRRVLDVQLERKRGRYVYEVETLDRGGKVRRQRYDASTGRQLR